MNSEETAKTAIYEGILGSEPVTHTMNTTGNQSEDNKGVGVTGVSEIFKTQ